MPAPSGPAINSSNLVQDLLGASFHTLPAAVKSIHHHPHAGVWRGACKVLRGKGWPGRLMAFAAKLPPAGEDVPVSFTIRCEGARQHWIRRFGKHEMASVLTREDCLLQESLGPVRFLFQLEGSAQGIRWIPVRIRAMGMPVPLSWFRFHVQEHAEDGRYNFNVRVSIKGLGLLVHYEGWLDA